MRAVEEAAGGLQVATNAPPQVEVVVGRRPNGDTIVHLINHSGHQDRSYHEPLPVFQIELTLALVGDPPQRARALVAEIDLGLDRDQHGRVRLALPRLGDFDAIVLSR